MMELSGVDSLAILRIMSGLWFIPHCIGKIRHVDLASQTFAKAGLRPARAFVILTIVLELLAGAGLVLGVYPQLAAALAALVLLGASYAVVKINGCNWRWQKMGPEFMMFWSATCILSVLH